MRCKKCNKEIIGAFVKMDSDQYAKEDKFYPVCKKCFDIENKFTEHDKNSKKNNRFSLWDNGEVD